jgi:hypothetical protein
MFSTTVEWPEWSWLSASAARAEGGGEASTSGEAHCGFDSLPAEVLHEVLRRVGSARDRARCKLVCRDWSRSVSQLPVLPLLLAASESNALQVRNPLQRGVELVGSHGRWKRPCRQTSSDSTPCLLLPTGPLACRETRATGKPRNQCQRRLPPSRNREADGWGRASSIGYGK